MTLPILVFLLVFLILIGSRDQRRSFRPWQGDFLLETAVGGVLLVGITEGLSLFKAINRLWLAAIWSGVLIALLIISLRSGRLKRGLERLSSGFSTWEKTDYFLLLAIAAIALVLKAVALVSPSNYVDMMQYQMPRVLHSVQNKSLHHYPAVYSS